MNATETTTERLSRSLYNMVVNKARALISKSGLTKPPFLAEDLAKTVGIRVVRARMGAVAGLLLITKEGFLVKVNSSEPLPRQNFSCAHEIAHVFLLQKDAIPLTEALIRQTGQAKYSRLEETLCNVGAAELLMPYAVFHHYASQYDFCVDAVVPLSETFATSVIATAIRVGQVSPRQCYVIQWTNSEKSPSQQPKLRISWAVSSKTRLTEGRSSFTSLKMLTDPNCNAFEAYDSDCPVRSREFLALKGFRGLCDIESQGFGRGQHRYVISLVFPRDKPT